MRFLRKNKLLLAGTVLVTVVVLFVFSTQEHQVDFNTEVKPIFNKKCISCHGGVKRQGGFSLLFRSEAVANTESGKPAIIPGDPANSELIRRLTLNDPEERMPYKHPPLSEQEISTLRHWIKQGAQWGDHWAYVAVQPVEVPDDVNKWVRNPIDHFIYQKLREQELEPASKAPKAELLRRVSLDITGMPASISLAEQFLKDSSERAYEILVDSLLASTHFGEKWTSMWLDLARYADTKGYERDVPRNIWRYRDWLINAFNDDKPYDQFLTEQLAGDLLPDATTDQLIATAFHRNTMTNDEGGTDNEEFRTIAVIDRVNTTWEALMGTTFACVQCHSHPYDPFTHDEYYKFMAFFNNSRDEDTYEDYPVLRQLSDSQQVQLKNITGWIEKNSNKQVANKWKRFINTWEPSIHSVTADSFVQSALNDTKWLVFRNNGRARFKQVELTGKNNLVLRFVNSKVGGTLKLHLDRPDGPVILDFPVPVTPGWSIRKFDLVPTAGVHDLYFTYANPTITNPDQNTVQFDWLHFSESFPGNGQPDFKEYYDDYWKLLTANTTSTPIMLENPEDMYRPSFIFERGNWLVKTDEVKPMVPHSLNPMPANAPANRLGLAMWMTDKKNPLTARTMVNRVWEQLFGVGLVETLEDLGTQGAVPTHRALLDWLSWQFMHEYNWSIKKLIRTIVLSATYMEDSRITPEILQKDPDNKFYARGMRVRLSAEQIRDQALCISGLLNPGVGGPSVFPYQPEGIWKSPWNGADWVMSAGDEQYRRALYTFWKRTAPYPSMMTFDGAAREVCTARRIRTNTPLQALVTLNDKAYLQMARHFAFRMQEEGGATIAAQIGKGYELATYKPIPSKVLSALVRLYNESYGIYKYDMDKGKALIGNEAEKYHHPETAALVVVANAMLNMDELVTKN